MLASVGLFCLIPFWEAPINPVLFIAKPVQRRAASRRQLHLGVSNSDKTR